MPPYIPSIIFICFSISSSQAYISYLSPSSSSSSSLSCDNDIFCQAKYLELYRKIEERMKTLYIPGIVLSVIYQNECREFKSFYKHFGHADIRKRQPIQPLKTKFAIGSISKSFTASLMLLLLEEHRDIYPAGLDTPISDFLGQESLPVKLRHHQPTIRDILAHRLAVKGYSILLIMGIDPSIEMQEFCRRIHVVEIGGEFRVHYQYSNLIYIVAGCIIEIIGGASYELLLKEKLLKPLKMEDTVFISEMKAVQYRDLAGMYFFNYSSHAVLPLQPQILESVIKVPSIGGVISTAPDINKWMKFHLNEGKTEDGISLIQQWDELHTLHQFTSQHKSGSYFSTNYPFEIGTGLGWFLGLHKDYIFSYHTGRIGAFDSLLATFPSNKFGVFISSNGPAFLNTNSHFNFLLHLHAIFSNDSSWAEHPPQRKNNRKHQMPIHCKSFNTLQNNLSHKNNHHKSHHTTFSSSPIQIEASKYVGIYGNHLFGNITISLDPEGTNFTVPNELTKVSNLYFKYGMFGAGILTFHNADLCLVKYQGSLDFMSWINSTPFSSRISFSKIKVSHYRSIAFYPESLSVKIVFHRNLKWHPTKSQAADVEPQKNSFSRTKIPFKTHLLLSFMLSIILVKVQF